MPMRASVRASILCCAFIPLAIGSQALGKEYVCRDPDTGMLHETNTTWRSTTFCGNYTCNIRRLNTTTPPSKVFVSLFKPQEKASASDKVNTDGFPLSKLLPELARESDRLLNSVEIQKITELLHSVKKSDLQAVIELYNVAQEIYKDMKVPDNARSSEETFEDSSETNELASFYTPDSAHRKANDMMTLGTAQHGTYVYPTPTYANIQPYFYSKSLTNYPNYITGPVLNNEKMAYPVNPQLPNSPLSRQGLQSYYAQRSGYDVFGATEKSPCNLCTRTYQYQMPLIANYPQKPTNMYPSTIPNYTQNYNNFYKGNPWAFSLAYPKSLPIDKNMQIVVEPTPDEKNVVTEAKDVTNSWKTDPLSEEIINEIRANIAQRGKLINIPLKKRIKLERVSKVIKLNQSNRKVRSISNSVKSEDNLPIQETATKVIIEDTNTSQVTVQKENIKDKVLGLETVTNVNNHTKQLTLEAAPTVQSEVNVLNLNTSAQENVAEKPSSQVALKHQDTRDNYANKETVLNETRIENGTVRATSLITAIKANTSQVTVQKENIKDKVLGLETVTNVNNHTKNLTLEAAPTVQSEVNVLNLNTSAQENVAEKPSSQMALKHQDTRDNYANKETVLNETRIENGTVRATSLITAIKASSEENVARQEKITTYRDIEEKLASKEELTQLKNIVDKIISRDKIEIFKDVEDKPASKEKISTIKDVQHNFTSQENITKVKDIEDKLASQDTVPNAIDKDLSKTKDTNIIYSVENKEMLETYIEKVTCEPPTELGYFKMGNLTQPYPDCCPKKIEDKER